MRKRGWSFKLSFVFSDLSYTILILLLFSLQQSYASDRWEEDDIVQPQSVSKTVKSEPRRLEASYGDFDVLSEDILFHHVLPRCDRTIIQVNCSFFALVTGYASDHIFDQGLEHRPTKPVCCINSNAIFEFINHLHDIKKMPSFVWHSLIRHVRNISSSDWSYLKGSYVYTVTVKPGQLHAQNAYTFCQNLQGTFIQIINLSYSKIGNEDIQNLSQGLKNTQVHSLYLIGNQIGAPGAKALGQVLKDTHIHTLDLSRNNIKDEGTRDLGQALKDSKVHTLNLSRNYIGKAGAKALAQSLKGTKVRILDLSVNNIGDEGAITLGQAIKNTKVRTLNLSWNNISQKMPMILREMLPRVELTFENENLA